MTMAVEKTLKSYENCCRTCLNEETSFDIFMETLNTTNLADILISCTRLNIQQEDCLPKKMCVCCYNCLVSFYNFRELALKVDARLRANISSSCDVNSSDDNKSDKYPFEDIVENNIDGNHCTLQPKVETDYGDIEVLDENISLDIYTDTDTNIFPDLLKLKITKKEKLECTHCKKTFRKLSRFKDHIVKHNILKNNDHNTCSELINHQETETTYSSIEGEDVNDITVQSSVECFTCRICCRKFKSTNSLSAHMRKHVEKGRVISCPKCGKVFTKISHLKRHEIVHDGPLYKCSVCPRSFQSAEVLKGHMNKHNGIKPHNCPLCTKSFAHLITLKTHIKMHNKDKFLCPTCGKKFDSRTSLDQHVKRHLGLKQFECKLCPRKFVSKGELQSHTVTHTGERSYTCSQCGGTFTKQSSLRKHKLGHLGIKPHQCEICLMKFSNKDHLKRHIRIHTGEKPYKCDICERAYTQSNDLVKHRRSHLGEKIYKCTECSESFRFHIELRQHISEHYISSKLQMLNKNNKDNMEVSREDTNIDNIGCIQIDNNITNK